MKCIVLFIILLYGMPSMGQTYLIREGKLADTTTDFELEYGSPLPYYYSVGGKYPKSSSTLLKEVKEFSKKQNHNYTGNGYITFRFVVDTAGVMKNKVKVMQTDDDYKAMVFDRGLVNELFAYLQTLNEWPVARYRTGEALEYISFIMFKLKNGKVINIVP
jgi:hypothetical protein